MDRRKPSPRGVPLAWSPVLLTIFLALMTIPLDVRHGVVAQAGQGQEQLGARVQEDILQRQTDDRQWVMPARNYASTRYSGLDKITTDNVKNLQLAWTFSTGVLCGHEAAPLVVNDTMYIVTPRPNILYAIDLTQPGAPIKWKYEPQPTRAAQGAACCDVVNRGAAYADGKIFYNTLDNHTVATDANTGRARSGRPRSATLTAVNR